MVKALLEHGSFEAGSLRVSSMITVVKRYLTC